MVKNYDTKSNAIGDNSQDDNATNQEPPPLYMPPKQEGNSSDSHAEGGITEQTHLLFNNNTLSYTLPRQLTTEKSQTNAYLPTPNLSYTPPSDASSYQQPGTIIFRPTLRTLPLENLSTTPAITICPHCDNIALSYIQYKSGSCTWLSCFIISHTLIVACFIPFCINDLKDVIHYCSNCDKIIAIY